MKWLFPRAAPFGSRWHGDFRTVFEIGPGAYYRGSACAVGSDGGATSKDAVRALKAVRSVSDTGESSPLNDATPVGDRGCRVISLSDSKCQKWRRRELNPRPAICPRKPLRA
jgi:hypothetical protein